MKRLGFVTGIASVVLVACVGAADAEVKEVKDPHGDSYSGRAFDIEGLRVQNAERVLVTTTEMATLKPQLKVTLQMFIFYPGPNRPVYDVTTTRRPDRSVGAGLYRHGPDAYERHRVPCKVRAVWGVGGGNMVRVAVPQSCLPEKARATFSLRASTAPNSQDPPEGVRDVTVARG